VQGSGEEESEITFVRIFLEGEIGLG